MSLFRKIKLLKNAPSIARIVKLSTRITKRRIKGNDIFQKKKEASQIDLLLLIYLKYSAGHQSVDVQYIHCLLHLV